MSLNELPCNMRSESNLLAISENSNSSSDEVEKIDKNIVQSGRDERKMSEEKKVVKMDAHGNPIYDSNSLKRKKGAITTFSPGPCVKEEVGGSVCTTIETTTSLKNRVEENPDRKSPQSAREAPNSQTTASIYRRTNQVVRPVVPQRVQSSLEVDDKNNNNPMTSNNHLMRPNGSLSLNLNSVSSKVLASGTIRGAYVNIQDSAPLLNGPPVYSPPSPSRAAAIFGQHEQVQDDGGKNQSAAKIVDFTPKKIEGIQKNGDIDPVPMRAHVKRSNSYRLAAIYADPSESLTVKNVRKSFLDSSDDEPYLNISKSVTRSFEKLIEEFSQSTSAIISTDLMLNEGLREENRKRYSLEPPKLIDLNDYMTDSSFDDVTELGCVISTHKSPLHIPSPSKVTLPRDSAKHKARVLMKNFDTEIW